MEGMHCPLHPSEECNATMEVHGGGKKEDGFIDSLRGSLFNGDVSHTGRDPANSLWHELW